MGSGPENGKKCDDTTKKAAYALAGFSLLLTLTVGMNGAPFCMKRFKIPEHLFSLYVSRVHNCMELGCFGGVTFATIYTIEYDSAGGQECKKVSIGINWGFSIINLVLFLVFVTGGEEGHLTDFYWTLSLSAFIYGMNYLFIVKLAGNCIVYFLATIHVSGIFVSIYHFIFLKLFGNRRKFNTDFLIITWQIILSIIITAATASVWTAAYYNNNGQATGKNKCRDEDGNSNGGSFTGDAISPMIMSVFAQGVVYVFYPAIAPGLLVDFRHVNKIDQALLIIAPIPAIIIAVLDATEQTDYSPNNEWKGKPGWHGTLIFIPVMIICGYLFIKALHYPHSGISLAIVNKPGMVGFLTILFYVSHMILNSVGRSGLEKNSGPAKKYLPTINGFMATTAMILLIFLSEGYVNEFKKHDRSFWPTQGLSKKRAFGFWIDKAIQNGFKNFLLIFTRDLRRDLMSALD